MSLLTEVTSVKTFIVMDEVMMKTKTETMWMTIMIKMITVIAIIFITTKLLQQ